MTLVKTVQTTLLSPRQVEEQYGPSVSTLAKMRLTGTGPVYVKLGRRIAYRIEDLESWVLTNRFRSTSEYGAAKEGEAS
ncbi:MULTISPECIES: helix-turn-helix transcriptional regulator [unclassified Hyphomonas]|jgi:predicted DNA-binding transcriptional regulator AlpA|uniref:helix-turn-helix transcriptional regulator n=1 Tax=unclassified Hyphomonas TaxID=2630699 RepID=UPI0025C0FFFC|nr:MULTISPECIES: DNA-binding protein [unclassified Hyphomonas]|tara:strand:+ start:7424 stop:7660 length:237 start_codon:yes stop_codon:yes gene_type:complete